MSLAEQWALLGIAPTDDKREVKRAYGRVLKTIDVDADPAAFVRLREAMEAAMQWGTVTPWWEGGEAADEADTAGLPGETEEVELEDADHIADLDEDFRQWRPELPPEQEGPLARALSELEALLYGDPAAADPARIEALGESILADPELAQVDRAAAVEQWFAASAASTIPKSDPLIPMLIRAYGWDRSAAGWRRDWQVERLMARRDDLGFLAACARSGHPHHAALAELQGPPRQRLGLGRLSLARDVAALLRIIDQDRQTLLADLDEASVAWWRAYFVGPHLPSRFWAWWAGGTAVLFLAVALALEGAEAPVLPVWLAAAAAAAVALAAILIWARLAAANRRSRERVWNEEVMPKGLERYVAGALLLPPAAVLAPDGAITIAAASLAAAWLAYEIFRRSWIPAEWEGGSHRPRLFLPAVAGAAALFALLSMSSAGVFKLALPFLVVSWAGSQAFEPLRTWLAGLSRSRRLALQATALAVAVAALAATALLVPGWPPPGWALALVPAAIVAAHLAASAALVDVHIIEWPLRLGLAGFYFAARTFWPAGFTATVFTALALYGLAYAVIRLGMAIREELRIART